MAIERREMIRRSWGQSWFYSKELVCIHITYCCDLWNKSKSLLKKYTDIGVLFWIFPCWQLIKYTAHTCIHIQGVKQNIWLNGCIQHGGHRMQAQTCICQVCWLIRIQRGDTMVKLEVQIGGNGRYHNTINDKSSFSQ